MKYLTSYKIRMLDNIAQDLFSIPGILLMEHASLNLMAEILKMGVKKSQKIAFVCGKGNNGGDGFATARHLHNLGYLPNIFIIGKLSDIRKESDAWINAHILSKMNIPIQEILDTKSLVEALRKEEYTCFVDAVFGTGLSSPLKGIYPDIFNTLNGMGLPFIAVDVPSGLNADTGLPMPVAIKAMKTVTFAFAKEGFQTDEGKKYCGELEVVGIGLPKQMMENPERYLDQNHSER